MGFEGQRPAKHRRGTCPANALQGLRVVQQGNTCRSLVAQLLCYALHAAQIFSQLTRQASQAAA